MIVGSTLSKLVVRFGSFMLIAFSFSCALAAFDVHVVDDPGHYFGELDPEHAVAIAADGTIYIAYGGDNLYLASKAPAGSWVVETVDSSEVCGKYVALALDSNYYPHISYYERYNALKYAHWDGISWSTETVDSVGDTGQYNAIAIDGSDHPHISYHDFSNKNLKYAHWTGATWDIQTIDASTSVGQWSSIAIDSTNNPHIGYFDWSNNSLKYIYWTGTTWTAATVDAATAGQYTSMDLDGSNIPHFSYYDSSGKDLKYAYWDSGSSTWSISTLDSTGEVGRYSSLIVDANGDSHISYYDTDNGTIKYAKQTLTVWSLEVVESVGSNNLFPLFTSINVDGSGVPHVIYGKQTGSRILDLQHAQWTGAAWSISTVDSSRGAMEIGIKGTSIAIDTKGNLHICYIDRGNYSGNTAVKYGHWDGAAWNISIVDAGQTPATSVYEHHSPSITVDSKNRPHVSYAFSENYSGHTLKYASWDGAVWKIASVDAISTADTSIALDENDNPHISYRDRGNNDLRYAYWTGTIWDVAKVATTGGVGYGSSIALDGDNNPHISYYANFATLDYARWDGSSWNVETIGPAGVGITSLALDGLGNPHISFQNSDELKYTHWDGAGWNTEVVDSGGEVGWDTSIDLDSSSNPHIAYYDTTNDDLKYAKWDGAQWIIKVVDGSGNVGRYGAIVLDSSNRPHMSYVDMGNMSLKYAGDLSPFSWPMFLPAIINNGTP